MSGFAEDYIEVADRMREWYERYPDAAIRTEIVESTPERVTVKAAVYRLSEDASPAGTGHSALAIPGSTPYTLGSELENAETSAVGRALVMAGLPSKRVASADEIRTKVDEQAHRPTAPRPAAPERAGGTPRPPAAPSDDDDEWAGLMAVAQGATDSRIDQVHGACPDHNLAWSFKEPGTRKDGTHYDGFWTCPSTERPFCKRKPSREWVERNAA